MFVFCCRLCDCVSVSLCAGVKVGGWAAREITHIPYPLAKSSPHGKLTQGRTHRAACNLA